MHQKLNIFYNISGLQMNIIEEKLIQPQPTTIQELFHHLLTALILILCLFIVYKIQQLYLIKKKILLQTNINLIDYYFQKRLHIFSIIIIIIQQYFLFKRELNLHLFIKLLISFVSICSYVITNRILDYSGGFNTNYLWIFIVFIYAILVNVSFINVIYLTMINILTYLFYEKSSFI